jgi:hypothetical protein
VSVLKFWCHAKNTLLQPDKYPAAVIVSVFDTADGSSLSVNVALKARHF